MPHTPHNSPILLVLTRGPGRESRAKRLLPPGLAGAEAAFHQQSLLDVLDCGRRLGLQLVVSSPGTLELPGDVVFLDQRGRTFGERFADAVKRARATNSAPLLVVGTDTPGLSSEHLEAALAALEQEPEGVVLGPAVDGGFYLLASSRSLAQLDWNSVSWCNARTRSSLSAQLEGMGRKILFLRPQADLDVAADFERWLTSLPVRWRPRLAALKRRLAERMRPPVAGGFAAFALAASGPTQNRAPPR